MSSEYRGEGGSEGRKEVCLGEVDDVLQMLAIADVQPYVKPDRVLMWGGSHGGCVTLRAIERGAPGQGCDRRVRPRRYRGRLLVLAQSGRGRLATLGHVPAAHRRARCRYRRKHARDARRGLCCALAAQLCARSCRRTSRCRSCTAPPTSSFLSREILLRARDDGRRAELTAATPPRPRRRRPSRAAALRFRQRRPPATGTGSRFFVVYDGLDHGFFNTAQSMQMIQDAATFTLARL